MAHASGKQYKTKQKELILDCIRMHQGAFITIKDITAALKEQGAKVGTATIYRNLDKLEEEGIIARSTIEGIDGICYRFLPDAPEDVYFFLKCEKCGALSPVDCHELQKLYEHVIQHHHVRINPVKTVLYGLCETCLAQQDVQPEEAGQAKGDTQGGGQPSAQSFSQQAPQPGAPQVNAAGCRKLDAPVCSSCGEA